MLTRRLALRLRCLLIVFAIALSGDLQAAQKKVPSCPSVFEGSQSLQIQEMSPKRRLEFFAELQASGEVIDLQLKDKSWMTIRIKELSKRDFGKRQWVIQYGSGSIEVSEIVGVRRLESAQKGPQAGLVPIDLKLEKELSGVESPIWSFFRSKRAQIMTIYDFARDPKPYRGAVALGLATSEYRFFCELGHLVDYNEIYDKYDIQNSPYHTAEFMEHVVVSEGKPIVFFVPRSLFGYVAPEEDESLPDFLKGDPAGVTLNEFNWLYENPQYLKNVVFVLGSYNFVSWDRFTEALSQWPSEKVLRAAIRSYARSQRAR